GTPYVDMQAKGALLRLTRSSTRIQVARAVLEGIAFRTRQVINALHEEPPFPRVQTVQGDGGRAANHAFLQLQADILNTTIERPNTNQVTSLGIAYLAGLAVNFWESEEEIKQVKLKGKVFTPSDNTTKMQERFERWEKSVEAVRALS